jgi:hypothetical protein
LSPNKEMSKTSMILLMSFVSLPISRRGGSYRGSDAVLLLQLSEHVCICLSIGRCSCV